MFARANVWLAFVGPWLRAGWKFAGYSYFVSAAEFGEWSYKFGSTHEVGLGQAEYTAKRWRLRRRRWCMSTTSNTSQGLLRRGTRPLLPAKDEPTAEGDLDWRQFYVGAYRIRRPCRWPAHRGSGGYALFRKATPNRSACSPARPACITPLDGSPGKSLAPVLSRPRHGHERTDRTMLSPMRPTS